MYSCRGQRWQDAVADLADRAHMIVLHCLPTAGCLEEPAHLEQGTAFVEGHELPPGPFKPSG